MTRKEMQLVAALRQLNGKKAAFVTAEVVAVDMVNRTVDAKTADGLEIFDVSIQALTGISHGVVFFPEKGSQVLLAMLDDENAAVFATSTLQSIEVNIGNTRFTMDSSGYLLSRGDENLNKLLDDLLVAIQQMKFTTNTGVTINLVNVADFEVIQQRLNGLLKTG